MELTITKRSGEQITFNTTLSVAQSAAVVKRDLAARHASGGFASDLLIAWEENRASRNQCLWLMKLAADLQAPAPAADSRFQPIVDAIARMQDGRKSRVILRLQGLQMKACTMGANTGGVYLTRGDAYLGKLTRDGRLVLSGALGEQGVIALEQQLIDAAADPQAAAINYGKVSGRCACCGRDLSDPVSVWGGIGPVCLERLSGADARHQLEQAFKATQVGV